ncbi:MAG: YitT family protein, partial [Firmicutes bacterium]|nr:YitT family protein [Bacillota bacterium]
MAPFSWRAVIRDYFLILVGVSLTALGLVWFLIPNRIAAGGVSGLATIAFYLWDLPVGLSMLALNLPLFLACVREFGMRFGLRTLFGTVFLSVMVELWTEVLQVPLTEQPFLAALYGGLLTGVGMGLTFRAQGTTGGTDLGAQLLHRLTGISVGQSLLLLDGLVIALAGLVFHSTEAALLAIITVFVSGKAVDAVLVGVDYTKAALIISGEAGAIGRAILTEMGRGVTGLEGRGLYSGLRREVLLCVITRTEEAKLKEIVHRLDPRAFVIFAPVHEVLGEGFKEYT